MYPHRIRPIGCDPHAGSRQYVLRALSRGLPLPTAYVLWLTRIWNRDLPLAPVIPAWLPTIPTHQDIVSVLARRGLPGPMPTARHTASPASRGANDIPELQLEWSGDRPPELKIIPTVDWTEPPPVVLVGSLFDMLV
ncbi:MAG: hypothetical protein H6817_06350 [Phycisphaerales bacterium]|nr:hypothetical protein [Phycisphaerales bacterium]